jgi:protease-4
VWLGDEALKHGLVDRIGGLEDAIAVAREQAGIPEGERIRLIEFRRPPAPLLQRLVGSWVREAWERSMGLPEFESLQQRAEDVVEP